MRRFIQNVNIVLDLPDMTPEYLAMQTFINKHSSGEIELYDEINGLEGAPNTLMFRLKEKGLESSGQQ